MIRVVFGYYAYATVGNISVLRWSRTQAGLHENVEALAEWAGQDNVKVRAA